jgi:hypothetical protein
LGQDDLRPRETLAIAGFALDGSDWDGIYLGRRKGKDLVYAGKVDHGFDKASAADLRNRLTPLSRVRNCNFCVGRPAGDFNWPVADMKVGAQLAQFSILRGAPLKTSINSRSTGCDRGGNDEAENRVIEPVLRPRAHLARLGTPRPREVANKC